MVQQTTEEPRSKDDVAAELVTEPTRTIGPSDRGRDAAALHQIVVVGGGAAGLELATKLGDTLGRRGEAVITLVERSRSHLWKPLLHEVAAGSMDVDEHDLDYLAQAHWHHFRYRYGEMIGLDRARKEVIVAPTVDDEGRQITARRSFRYDTLVIAIGSVVNDFGTPGVKEHAIALDQTQQAARFNRRLVNACIRAHAQEEPVRPGQLDVAIIGAGATGTELAAELHRTTRAVVAYGLDRVDPEKDIHITLIEAADRILPGLPPRISEAAHSLLRNLGVLGPHRGEGERSASGRRATRRWRLHPFGARRLGGGGEGSGRAEGAGPRAQPEQPARGAADAADHARSGHLRHRRLRLVPARGASGAGAAPRPGRAPAGEPPPPPDPPQASGTAPWSPSSTRISARWSPSGSTRRSAT